MDSENEEDFSWIFEYERLEEKYETFYKRDVTAINVNFVYVNLKNEVSAISTKQYDFIKPNVIPKDHLVRLIKENMSKNNTNYKILSVLKYNIDIIFEDLPYMLSKPKDYPFLTSIDTLQDIHFKPTIDMFSEINTMYIVYYEKDRTVQNRSNTKKIIFKESSKPNLRKTKRK
jgi:hypothetical protein